MENEIVPFSKDAGNEFRYWRKHLLGKTVLSRINIQLVDLTLYAEQMEQLTRFVNDVRDALYTLKANKVGKTEREIEKLEAWAFFEMSTLAKRHNALMNAKLADKYPILVQFRDQVMPKTKALHAKSEKAVRLVQEAQDV